MIQYLEPEMDIIYFQETDVITSSGGELKNNTYEDEDDSGSASDIWGW